MNHGDWRKWLTEDMFKNLQAVVDGKQAKRTPYYIEVRINRNYMGPAAAHDEAAAHEVTLTAKRVYGVRMVCLDRKPIVAQLSTILFYVDNRRGLVKMVYAMPADMPNETEDSENYGTVVPQVAENAQRMGLPLFWN